MIDIETTVTIFPMTLVAPMAPNSEMITEMNQPEVRTVKGKLTENRLELLNPSERVTSVTLKLARDFREHSKEFLEGLLVAFFESFKKWENIYGASPRTTQCIFDRVFPEIEDWIAEHDC